VTVTFDFSISKLLLKVFSIHYTRHFLHLPRRLCNALRLSLSVSLLATVHKNNWTDLHENFNMDVSVHKEELIAFCKLSASGSRNFWKYSSTLRDRAFFHNLARWTKWLDFSKDPITLSRDVNFTTNVTWNKEVPVKFQKSYRSGLRIRTPNPDQILLRCLWLLLLCLSLCLLATLHKSYWTDLHDNFTTDVSVHKEELVICWNSSGSGVHICLGGGLHCLSAVLASGIRHFCQLLTVYNNVWY